MYKKQTGKSRMRKGMWLIVLFGTLFTIGCGESKKIEGVVLDLFGDPIPNVAVQVEKSEFRDITDSEGRYQLDYVAGNINVLFSAEGYTTESLELNIQEKAFFPASPTTLYPMPDESGVFLVDRKNKTLVNLVKSDIKKSNIRYQKGSLKINAFTYTIPNITRVPTLQSGNIEFIDTTKAQMNIYERKYSRLAKLGDVIYINQRSAPNHLVKEENIVYRGKEKVKFITVNLPLGSYVWAQSFATPGPQQFIPLLEKQTVRPFVFEVGNLETASASENGVNINLIYDNQTPEGLAQSVVNTFINNNRTAVNESIFPNEEVIRAHLQTMPDGEEKTVLQEMFLNEGERSISEESRVMKSWDKFQSIGEQRFKDWNKVKAIAKFDSIKVESMKNRGLQFSNITVTITIGTIPLSFELRGCFQFNNKWYLLGEIENFVFVV
jgi:hypothetical protein